MMEDWEITATLDAAGVDEIIEVPVDYILRNAVTSCDFGPSWDDTTEWWEKIIAEKAGDTGFGHLVDSILTRGWEPGSAVGFDGESINEGHHRLVAAILLCMPTVPVSTYGNGNNSLSAHADWSDPFPIAL